MAKLSNINGRFAVEDDGAIQFNGQAGTDGYVLESRGASAPPVWTDRDAGRITGSGAANRVTYWTGTYSISSDAGFTYNGAGRVNTDESFGVSKDGADTVADGPFFRLTNAAQDRQYLNQLDASNNIDYWYYNGTAWTQTISLLNNGGATFSGSVEIRSGNKLILQRPNNGVATEISTDSTGAMILNSINDEGFFFNNSGTNAFKLDPINATFAGTVTTTDVYGASSLRTAALGGIHYVDASSSLIFRTSGSFTERMRIDQTHGDKTFISSYSGGTFPLRIGFGSYASFTPTFVINDGGKVGIGTALPLAPLSVVTPAVAGINLTNISRTANNLVRFTNPQYSTNAQMGLLLRVFPDTDNRQGAGLLMTGGSDNQASNLSLFVSKDDGTSSNISQSYSALHIVGNTGNIGIGTTTPATQLEIFNTGTSVLTLSHDGGGGSGSRIDFNLKLAAVSQPVTAQIKAIDDGAFRSDIIFTTKTAASGSSGLSDRMVIKGGGNVGIGLTAPNAKLDVLQVAKVSFANSNQYTLRITNTDGNSRILADGSGAHLIFGTTPSGSSFADERMIIQNSGNVGIGLTAPGARLDILKETRISFADGNQYRTRITNTDGNTRIFSDGQQCNIIFGTTANVANGTATEAMRLSWEKYLGIGTTSPRQKLEVAGRTYIEFQGTDWNETTPGQAIGSIHLDPVGSGANNTGNAITFGASDHANGTTADAGIYTRSDGSYGTKMYLATTDSYAVGSKTRMMIDSTGNVGIGTTSPTNAKLVVAGKVMLNNANAPNNLAQLNIGYTGSGETRAIDIDGGWNGGENKSISFTYSAGATNLVGQINCKHDSPGSRISWGKLYHSGDSTTYTMELISSSQTTANLTVAGNITAQGDVVAYSDKRLKSNIKTLDGSKVLKMRGVSFEKEGKKGSGVIAQELEKVAPELVNNDNEYKGVAYGNLTGYLIEAIKELKAEIEELKSNKCNCNK